MNQNDQALALLQAEQMRLMAKKDTISQDFLVISYALGHHFYTRRNYSNALPHFEKALALQEKINPSNFANLADILSWKGLCVQRIMPQQAIPILDKALAYTIKAFGEKSFETANAYNDLGVLHGLVLEDFEKGEAYFAKAIRILKDAGLQESNEFVLYQNNIAVLQSSEGLYNESLHTQLELLPIMQQKHGYSINTGKLLCMIGENYAQMGNGNEALKYQVKAIDMLEKTDTVFKLMLHTALTYTSATYNKQHKPDSALILIERTYQSARELAKGKMKNPDSGLSLQYATSYYLLQKPDKALAYMDTAFLDEDYRLGIPFDSIRHPNFISMLLLEKTKFLLQKHDQDQKLSSLEAAQNSLSLAQEINTKIVGNFQNTRSKLSAYRELYRGFALANQILLAFYDKTGDTKYLREAFIASETSKSLLLYQQILEHKNRQKAKVPLQLALREEALKSRMVLLDKLLFEKKQAAQSPDNEAIQEEIFALKKQGELLREEIKAVCPDYFMKHPPLPKTDLKAVQNSLSANEAVLEFFTADSTITTFLLRRDTLIHSQITAKKEVEIQIKTFREAISAYFLSDTKSPDLYLRTAHEYVEAAYWLYQKMIMPIETYLPENVTIIPDGILAYLPFEALLSTKPQRPDRFHTHDYWNKKHSLRYTYSTALLREMSESPVNSATQSLLALAPFYDGSTQWHDSLTRPLSDRNRTEFTPLPFSGEEVYKVVKLMDGKALTGKIATKAAFQREAGQYRTLHLATHARANDGAGDYSYINFAPTPEYPQGERLYVSEIYGLRLNADLVTLSACETGLGKMYRGEGVVSIARAFASAGARCILQSQWTVSDAKTRHLMIYFYQNLKNGLAKDVALHLAKEEYLRKFKGEEAHPYFWAGFVLVGR